MRSGQPASSGQLLAIASRPRPHQSVRVEAERIQVRLREKVTSGNVSFQDLEVSEDAPAAADTALC